MDKLSKKIIIIITVIIIILAATVGSIIFFTNSQKTTSGIIIVKKSDLTEIVKSDGTVKPAKSVDLAFQNGGKINAVSVDVGSYVSAGQIIIRMDSADLNAQLLKSQADLSTQEAILSKSQVDLDNLYGNILNVLSGAYTKANDAVHNQADNLFVNGELDNPQLNFLTTDSQAQTDSQNGRLLSRTELGNWRLELSRLTSADISKTDLYASLSNAKNYLFEIQNFLISLMSAVNKIYNVPQATIGAYKTYVSAASAEVNETVTNITNQKQAIDSQNTAIDSQNSNINSYKAVIQGIEAQLSKTVIFSPINGIVSRQDAKVGQIVGPNVILVSVISASQYDVETYVSEADVAKIKPNNDVRITLDAYGNNVVFGAKVIKIDPAATIASNVPAYKITIIFEKADERIKSGMTANIFIIADKRDNVVAIPAQAIINKNGEKFVLVDTGKNNPEERKIETGILGDNGQVEVISGLEAGEKIISFGGT